MEKLRDRNKKEGKKKKIVSLPLKHSLSSYQKNNEKKRTMIQPDYIFESSWEVCNKVGGIYTVLSTKARTLQRQFTDKIIFIGPNIGEPNAIFKEEKKLYAEWVTAAAAEGLSVRVGRWQIPGKPTVFLVDHHSFSKDKNDIYYKMWDSFRVDSSMAYGDYDESCIFAYAVGKTIESFYRFYRLEKKQVVAHFNEWMLGFGGLYLQKHVPEIATIFTTHATSIGRSIAGNDKPLYSCLQGYDGDQMAKELHMEAKHSVEKQAARFADCFTTVSDITAAECEQLLGKAPDIVTPNGFEPDFVPNADTYPAKRAQARKKLLETAEKLCGETIDEDAFLVSTSGRYEYRNKGIDVYIQAMNRLRTSGKLNRQVIAFLLVPAWVYAPRADLKAALDKNIPATQPMQTPFITHWLNNMNEDRATNFIISSGFANTADDKLKIIFVPCYLDGQDGIFDLPYYDLLIGMDATVYPSYYEPWGYTPLESVAFGIPTITTDLAGFGLWAKTIVSGKDITEGVAVIHRTDDNYFQVVEDVFLTLLSLMDKDAAAWKKIRKKCFDLAAKAEWKEFIRHYHTAFDKAFAKAAQRIKKQEVSV